MSLPVDIVSEDAGLLISKFLARDSQLYSDFIETWNELPFYLLYCLPSICGVKGLTQKAMTNMAELVHKLLQVGAGHMCCRNDSDRNKQLAGLYLCYAVYFTQPLEIRAKIRVTIEDWEVINSLQAELKQKKMNQALYLIISLKNDTAFSICCTPCQMYLAYKNKDNPSKHFQACLPESSTGLVAIQQAVAAKSESYEIAKEDLSLYLPSHLLGESRLTQKIAEVIKEYPQSRY